MARKTLPVIESVEDLRTLLTEHPTLYVRYSRSHTADIKRGYSIDHASRQPHAGLSANRITADMDDAWLYMQVADYSFIKMGDPRNYCWVAVGEEAGRDSDGAPVIVNVKPLAMLSGGFLKTAYREEKRRTDALLKKAGMRLDD